MLRNATMAKKIRISKKNNSSGSGLTAEQELLVAKWIEAKNNSNHWKKEYEKLRQKILTTIFQDRYGAISTASGTIIRSKRSCKVFDTERFKKDHPELYEQYLNEVDRDFLDLA